METLEQKLNEISISKNLDFDSSHNVLMTHIIDPGDFYVRLTRYTPLIDEIENLKNLVKPTAVRIGQIIIFDFKSTNGTKFARGRVISAADNSFCVYAVDYGFYEESVHVDHIWKCHEILLLSVAPEMAINCQLSECAKTGEETWISATKIFKKEADGRPAKLTIHGQNSEKLVVNLLIDGWNDIALHLTLLDLTFLCLVGKQNTANTSQKFDAVKPKVSPSYKFNDLKVNVPMHVRVVSGKLLKDFYVAEINDYQEYMEWRKDITPYSKKESKVVEHGPVRIGTAVSVWQNFGYERGIVQEVQESNRILVHLVDSGKNENVHVDSLKTLPTQLLNKPVLAMHCSILSDLEVNIPRFLIPGNDFVIKIKEIGCGFESPHIVEWIRH
ncbi:uncharacterized protein LOC112047330 [Bicyclus anynana]|uniref:Uncharacterized protein LOC112047330 n=1 Tax=Bicyclus anynana TaxID=110368 RepID=A0A6J1NAY0_BICAN|nr:uncharacterized protein LOC112047330 [Bicyclus anynana]XP_052738329.1 uncharacterized protein LOC112047330 [Bicyclus anynana]